MIYASVGVICNSYGGKDFVGRCGVLSLVISDMNCILYCIEPVHGILLLIQTLETCRLNLLLQLLRHAVVGASFTHPFAGPR